jgi:predicted transcriptional regulator
VVFLGKNRDRLSLVAAILDAAGYGSTKTHVMIVANLSYKLLEKYLTEALNLGFVQRVGSKYSLTEQGRDFLKRYKQLQDKYLRVEQEFTSLMNRREMLERMCARNELADVVYLQRQIVDVSARTPAAFE